MDETAYTLDTETDYYFPIATCKRTGEQFKVRIGGPGFLLHPWLPNNRRTTHKRRWVKEGTADYTAMATARKQCRVSIESAQSDYSDILTY